MRGYGHPMGGMVMVCHNPSSGRYTRVLPPMEELTGDVDAQWAMVVVRHNPPPEHTPKYPRPWLGHVGIGSVGLL